MSKWYISLLLSFPFSSFGQIWVETFDGLPNLSISDGSPSSWNTTLPTGGVNSFSKQRPVTGYELFVVNDTGSEGIWNSEIIDISSHTEVAIEVTLYSYFTYSSDYIRCYYKIDGGPETQFGELLGSNGLSITSAASAIVSGNTLEIVVRGKDNTPGTSSTYGFPIINALAFDNVTITDITVLYSRSSGNWNNTITWSKEGFGGASCGCTPNANSRVVIGDNNIVSIPGASTTAGITVQNTGVLRYTANATMTMARGGTVAVKEGGTFVMNGFVNSSLYYGAYAYHVQVNGDLSIGYLDLNSGANVTFTGNGTMDIAGDFLIGVGSGRTVTNNISGSFTIGDELHFEPGSANAEFINNGNLQINNRLRINADNISFRNNGVITINSNGLFVDDNGDDGTSFVNFGTLNVGNINFNNGDFTLNNSGIVNQTGNFSNVGGGSSIHNLDGGVWNYEGTSTIPRLYTSASSNTFRYSASGDQPVSVPADGVYYNLSLSGFGLKSLSGNININSDLEISGVSALDVTSNNHSLTLSGDWVSGSSHSNPFLARSGTVTFSGTSEQNLTQSSGDESFYNLTINKASGNLTNHSDVSVSGVLALTNGGLDLNGNNLTILNSSSSAITRSNGFIVSETETLPYSKVIWAAGENTGTYVFPFGKSNASGDYIPFTFDITTSGAGSGVVGVATYDVSADNLPLPDGVTNLLKDGVDNRENVVDRFWQIDLSGYSSNPTVSVTFTATPDEIGSITDLRAQRWNSLGWDPPLPDQVNPTVYSVTVPGVSSFSPWTLSGNNTFLPVDLAFFTAVLKGNEVEMEWKTFQEFNNDYFTVEKTRDFQSFDVVAQVEGAGTRKTEAHYKIVDRQPWTGISYYRLKQTDFDGGAEYFKPVMVEYMGKESFQIYPNPLQGNAITFKAAGYEKSGTVLCEVINSQGNVIYSTLLDFDNEDDTAQIIFPEKPISGIYLIRIGTLQNKILVN